MHARDPYRSRPAVAQPALRVYGVAAQLMLAASIAVECRLIGAVHGQRSLIDRVLSGEPGITVDDAGNADHRAHIASNWTLLVISLTAVAFVVWFWRLRTTAAVYAPEQQRRSRPWALWGWLVPIVNFWFPFQMAVDAIRSVPDRTPRGERLLRAWWAAYVLAILINRFDAVRNPTGVDAVRTQTTLELIAAVVAIVAALLAIAVVEMITRDYDGYRNSQLPRRRPAA